MVLVVLWMKNDAEHVDGNIAGSNDDQMIRIPVMIAMMATKAMAVAIDCRRMQRLRACDDGLCSFDGC